MSLPFADDIQIARVSKLIYLINEFDKPQSQRDPHLSRMLEPFFERRLGAIHRPRFCMETVYSGKQSNSGQWRIVRTHALGLAAFHPWFHAQGLHYSVITHPRDYDTLDVCGVLLLNPDGESWRRVNADSDCLANFFGICPEDWLSIVDSTRYFEDYSAFGASVRPWMVSQRLYRLTGRSHGLIDPALPEPGPVAPSPLDTPVPLLAL